MVDDCISKLTVAGLVDGRPVEKYDEFPAAGRGRPEGRSSLLDSDLEDFECGGITRESFSASNEDSALPLKDEELVGLGICDCEDCEIADPLKTAGPGVLKDLVS
jgi:hypothetical protein